MSIDDDLSPQASVTEGDRALELFTDRYSFTRLFVERLNEDPPPKQILFLHGEGGNGKSLLLKFLNKHCCKRLLPETWEQYKRLSNIELARRINQLPATAYLAVPYALLDFGLPLGDIQPQDRFYGLLALRRNLGEAAAGNYWLRFPRYDFACVWYLHHQGKSPDEIKALFPLGEVSGLITTLLDILTGNSLGALGKAVLDFFGAKWSERLTVALAGWGLDKAEVEKIRSKDPDRELIDELPQLLAEDLNAAMAQKNAPKRIVLFFDTHEAFWGDQRNLSREKYFYQDEWLRRLLRKLNLEAGIVVVSAGRDQPRWHEAQIVKPRTEIPLRYVQLQRVGPLVEADALAYLQQVGITDEELCRSLIAYASVEPDQVHPLHLGLGADVVLEANRQGAPLTANDFAAAPKFEEKSQVLIERLLKYVNEDVRYAIHALSACRAFNFELYGLLAEALKFSTERSAFDRLTRFSFVWRTEQRGQDWYRIHNLLRRLDDEQQNEQAQAAHVVLERYYRAQDEIAEAIYHANRLDWRRGVDEWVETFDRALELSRYEACRVLLGVRRELLIGNDFQLGRVSQSEGQYFQQLARYEEARQEYLEAIEAYDEALARAPDDINALNNKGNALASLGDLQRRLSQHPDALGSYQQAIEAYDEALARAPDDINALNNKG
ncbi:MAG: hypothetical protein QNJ46_34175, partial [Leptolyngbyaceae cyanobacterium MO_188.B28]|nr:hypothetical protein [Leptolyngbyaceae cyanobacterium MO_188.B28]